MDCEWAWSNMPVWLDSLPLFFFFLNASTQYCRWFSIIPKHLYSGCQKFQWGCRAQQLSLLRVCLRDEPFSAPKLGQSLSALQMG